MTENSSPQHDSTPDATLTAGYAATPGGAVPVSVWLTAQAAPAAQRLHQYVPASAEHPAKMLPATAAHAIAHYSEPDDLVLDPMCGIGTTLVEAVRAERRALGIEYERRWAEIATDNLALAASNGATGSGEVIRGDARHLHKLLPPHLHGTAALAVTSPPYGPSVAGRVRLSAGKVEKFYDRYGDPLARAQLANIGRARLLSGFTRILATLSSYLRPGGHVVVTVRPWRENAELVDLPSLITTCGSVAGLIPVERCVALLARAGDSELIARPSFHHRNNIAKFRAAGLPAHLVTHEDVLVFRTRIPHSPAPHPAATIAAPAGDADRSAA